MISFAEKIALGTVQFGLNYGVANTQGKVPIADVRSIIQTAKIAGITTLDTAIAYGDSESVLGNLGCQELSVVTKLPEVPAEISDIGNWVEQQVSESLARLKVTQLDGLLLHRPEQLNGKLGENLYHSLLAVRDSGAAKRIGISIYEPQELDDLPADLTFDLIQAPYNPFDQRLATSGWLAKLTASGTAVHLRSIFLQGLLLMDPMERPSKFMPWKTLFDRWDTWLLESKQTPLEACLNHALSLQGVEKVVIGINSQEQLRQMLGTLGTLPDLKSFEPSINDPRILNPAEWNLL